ncbi:MAG: hypothetical protein JO060_09580, partial [Candidatus Eremiobacteraeota bacterium]|nr:hypothetical protein [Candidatus Eremiobacteraeota bacterium]
AAGGTYGTSNEVYAVTTTGQLYNWNGANWSGVSLPNGVTALQHVAVDANANAWVTTSNPPNEYLEWNGTSWSLPSHDLLDIGGINSLFGIDSSSNVDLVTASGLTQVTGLPLSTEAASDALGWPLSVGTDANLYHLRYFSPSGFLRNR